MIAYKNLNNEIDIKDVILPSFHDYWWYSRENLFTHYVCKGGRNSSKSTTISIDCIYTLMTEDVNGLVVRKVERTLQKSVFEQLKEATYFLGVTEDFIFNVNPLKITYKPKGNYIIFRGANDPAKIKSIKTAGYPIGFCWFEEVSEFKTEKSVREIMDSVLRSDLTGLKYKFFYSYNPPKRKQHWLNKKYETQFIPKNTYVHHSTYLNNPYLSEQTIEEINITKELNEREYKWNYLGMPIGGGIVPFDNLEFREIKEDEFKTFDNLREGLDWGYAIDPFCWVQWHYDKTRKNIYAMNEVYGIKLSNKESYDKIKDLTKTTIIADSAEPKSISEMKSYGLKIKGAKKGIGSVEYGEKWLDGLNKIIIDPERTPNIAREFENIDYEVDKDGNLKSRLEDKDNHSIDSTRYSLERDMKNNNWIL